MVRRRSHSQPPPPVLPSEPAQTDPEAAPIGLHAWLAALPGAPEVHLVVEVGCDRHGDDPGWSYVEADASAGALRRRCLACGDAVSVLDSALRWSYPPMWSCRECRQSIAELAAGLHIEEGGHVRWVVLGARCVECSTLVGLTDIVVPGLPTEEVLRQL